MSKKFSKTRKISRKQRSKRNKKTRSNRKVFGGNMDRLYLEAIEKFNERDATEQDKIKDAIDNLSKLGKNVPGSEKANPYNLALYETKQKLLDASEKIKQTKIAYIQAYSNSLNVDNITKLRKCKEKCYDLVLVERQPKKTIVQKLFSKRPVTICDKICDTNKE